MIKVGVIGYGYWGPNVARNFNLPGLSEVVAIADKSKNCQKRAQKLFRKRSSRRNAQDILSPLKSMRSRSSLRLDALRTGQGRLENGKHVFVEKPFTASVRRRKN